VFLVRKNTNPQCLCRLWEVRVQLGGNIFRLLGFIEGDNLVILTNGFQKKTQKTPRHEIGLAETRKSEYQSREVMKNG
jgi:phage-related protein